MAPDEPRENAIRKQYDWTTISPASAVVETVSTALDRAPTSFGPLYDYIDPDALNTVVASSDPTEAINSTVVSFLFEAHKVAVYGSGEVVVRPNASSEA
jgi:hypothetical protein